MFEELLRPLTEELDAPLDIVVALVTAASGNRFGLDDLIKLLFKRREQDDPVLSQDPDTRWVRRTDVSGDDSL